MKQCDSPVRHPWLREQMLDEIGACNELPEYQACTAGNARVVLLLASDVPESLIRQALFEVLLASAPLRFGNRVLFSGSSVIVPDGELLYDQVGLPEEMAWALFAPLVARELGQTVEVHTRSPQAHRLHGQ
jgi:hypothetical protein